MHNRVKKSLPKAPTAESLSDDEYYDVISDFEIEHSTQLAIDATLSGVLSLKKDVEKIIKRKESFFQSLSVIDRVYVLGFSFSPIDIPYLGEIIRQTSSETHWIISWYSQDDNRRIMDFVTRYDIHNITMIKGIKHIDLQV